LKSAEAVQVSTYHRIVPGECWIFKQGGEHSAVQIFFRYQAALITLHHPGDHSGNIFVIDEKTIGLVDFGIVGWIDKEMQENLADLLIGFVKEDLEGLTRLYLKMGILPEDIDEPSFRREYWEMMQHYFSRPFSHVNIGELFLDYIRLATRYRIRLPRDLLVFDKCIIELEGLARVLYPDLNLIKEAEPYAAELVKTRLSPVTFAKESMEALGEFGDLVKKMPRQTDQILKKIIGDKVSFEVSHRGIEEFIGEMDRSSNRLTFGVIIAAIIVGSSLVITSEAGPHVAGYPVLGVFGFLMATCFGLWLAFRIVRSGKY